MGTVASEDFFSGTAAALAGGTTMIIDFVHPRPAAAAARGLRRWRGLGEEGVRRLLASTSRSPGGRSRCAQEMGALRATTASTASSTSWPTRAPSWSTTRCCCKSFRAAASSARSADRPRRERRAGLPPAAELLKRGITGPRATALAAAGGRGRGRQPRDRDRRRSSACRSTSSTTPASEALEAIARARGQGQRVYGEVLARPPGDRRSRLPQPRLGHAAAAYVMSPPFRAKEHQEALWRGLQAGHAADHGDRPLLLLRAAEGDGPRRLHRRSRTAPAASRTAWRCCGTTA